MSRWYFVPDDWVMSDELLAWTKAKGLTDQTIENELESFRDHQYKRLMIDPNRCWRNWVRNGIRWGNITPVIAPSYRTIEEELPAERDAAILAFNRDMKRYRK